MPSHQDGQQRRIGGRYLLSTLLGSGAMGTVWSGYDEVLQRRVAVKELKVPPGVPADEARDMRERIMREARALGGLSHPNVITVFDVVVDEGAPVVVLEMVPSLDLATMIGQQGTLTAAQAAVIGFTTAGALRAAHRAGITHRDVKPGNVLVADDGRVKLTDFGIARNVADAPMTSAGLVLGSPAYIAPEVAAGQPVTTAADLWGLGATLFAAVEGRPPYDVNGDPVRTITEVVDGPVPRPRTSGPVGDVIAALMVKAPERRMSLEEVRRRLRPLILDPDDPVYPGSPDAPTLAAPIAVPRHGGARPSATPNRRPGATESGPPSLVKQDRPTRSGAGPHEPGRRAGPPAGPPAGPQRTSTGSGEHARPGTAAEPGPADPVAPAAAPGPGAPAPTGPGPATSTGSGASAPAPATAPTRGVTGSDPHAQAGPAPLASAPGPLPPELRAGPPSQPGAPAWPRPGSASFPVVGNRPGATPLASGPGPLPHDLQPVRPAPADRAPAAAGTPRPVATGVSGWAAVGLVVAGAAVVLAGIAAGWGVTRVIGGESPFSTTVTSGAP